MLTVSTPDRYDVRVRAVPRKSARTRPRPYHHGDLRRALLEEAVRTIREEGVEALTLRAAGERLGVSRTALYRHFTDKAALLAGVAREGFQRFRQDLADAWERAGGGREGFAEMGLAYVRFALANQSHYRVMFGAYSELCAKDPQLEADGAAAFQVLVDALRSLQRSGEIVEQDPHQLGAYVWATVHGIAMLAIDGQLGRDPSAAETLYRFGLGHLQRGIAAASDSR